VTSGEADGAEIELNARWRNRSTSCYEIPAMKRVLILILAMFAFAAPIPALATQAMCADTMQMMAAMDHGPKKGSCCDEKRDEKHRACMIACDAMRTVALVPPTEMPRVGDIAIAPVPPASPIVFTVAKITHGLDRPPRPIV
jgi:hypothetical protein